jgi:long-subunit acyl-CoA synthetase (AMP-forming)
VKNKFCPVIQSHVEGTPDLKMIGIFAENRPEWYITELASSSDSITIVAIPFIS